MKYIPADKLIAEIERRLSEIPTPKAGDSDSIENFYRRDELMRIKKFVPTLQHEPRFPQYNNIVDKVFGAGNLEGFEYREAEMLVSLAKEELLKSLQQEQPNNMIQWTGNNLKEVIDFTGKSPKFGEWFKSWDEFESYVHSHGDILKLFSEDGSHFEVPVGAWIVKTPDGYNVPSVAKYIQQERPIEGKQVIIITETNGEANIHWDCRSLDDVRALLTSAESFITDKQIEELRGQGSGPDYDTTEGRFRNAHKFQQEQPEVDLVQFIMEYEKKSGEKIPDHWLAFSTGTMKTVKLK